MSKAVLTIASKNYGSWSLRGWLLCKMAKLDFEEQHVGTDDPSTRAELLLLSPSFLVPCLINDGLKVWDTLAIAEYLHEIRPGAGLLPADQAERAHCRAISGEMHSGFSNLRSALPMNLKAHFPASRPGRGPAPTSSASPRSGPNVSASTAGLICSEQSHASPTPCTRRCARAFSPTTSLDPLSAQYCRTIMALPQMQEWIAAAKVEPDELEELDVEF